MLKYLIFLTLSIISISNLDISTHLNKKLIKLNKESIGDFPTPLNSNKTQKTAIA